MIPGSSVHGILQARTLEWVVIPFSRASSRPRDRTQVSCTAGGFSTIWAQEGLSEVTAEGRNTRLGFMEDLTGMTIDGLDEAMERTRNTKNQANLGSAAAPPDLTGHQCALRAVP